MNQIRPIGTEIWFWTDKKCGRAHGRRQNYIPPTSWGDNYSVMHGSRGWGDMGPGPTMTNHKNTVNSEIFARILFSRIALKCIFATLEIRDLGMIYLSQ